MKEPYDWDAYAAVFAPHAEKLVARAEEAEKAGEIEKASVLYLYVLDRTCVLKLAQTLTPQSQTSICSLPHFALPRPTIRKAA